MPKINHKPVSYPIESSQYQIVTPTGVVSCMFEDEDLALARFAKCDPSWRLIKMTISKVDITPADHDKTAPLTLSMPRLLLVG